MNWNHQTELFHREKRDKVHLNSFQRSKSNCTTSVVISAPILLFVVKKNSVFFLLHALPHLPHITTELRLWTMAPTLYKQANTTAKTVQDYKGLSIRLSVLYHCTFPHGRINVSPFEHDLYGIQAHGYCVVVLLFVLNSAFRNPLGDKRLDDETENFDSAND